MTPRPPRALRNNLPRGRHTTLSPPMPATFEDLFAFLSNLGIATETVEHPPLHTVKDSQGLRGDIPGANSKNLFVKDKKSRLFLLTLGEETQVDLKKVHEKIGGQG